MLSYKRLFMDVHVIQTLPPSNINRDDSGSPKTAQYGGVRRARVSSQAWKRAMRNYFIDNSEEELGVRTKHIVSYVAKQICELDNGISNQDAMQLAEQALEAAGLKIDKKEKLAKALFFLGKKQAVSVARAAIDNRDNMSDKKIKDVFRNLLGDNPEIDIALFGRMVADNPSLNEDASAQVAHAISTHAVQTEFDYYTAMDDQNPSDQAGAGMIGMIEYNSATLYRYANVAVHELLRQIGDKKAVINVLKLFTEAFSNSLPTGKVNTFANQTVPQAIMVNIRDDRPVSLVSAYEDPVKSVEGYARKSVDKMFEELHRTEKYVHRPVATFYLSFNGSYGVETGKEETDLSELLEDLGKEFEILL